ncbi:hypothetical protein GCM10027292_21320 [Hydrogenophaga aquatica]
MHASIAPVLTLLDALVSRAAPALGFGGCAVLYRHKAPVLSFKAWADEVSYNLYLGRVEVILDKKSPVAENAMNGERRGAPR